MTLLYQTSLLNITFRNNTKPSTPLSLNEFVIIHTLHWVFEAKKSYSSYVAVAGQAISLADPRSCRNPPPAGEDKLAGCAQEAPTNGSSTSTPATSRAPSCDPNSALAPVPGSVLRSTNELFKQVMKAYMVAQPQLSSAPNQTMEPRE